MATGGIIRSSGNALVDQGNMRNNIVTGESCNNVWDMRNNIDRQYEQLAEEWRKVSWSRAKDNFHARAIFTLTMTRDTSRSFLEMVGTIVGTGFSGFPANGAAQSSITNLSTILVYGIDMADAGANGRYDKMVEHTAKAATSNNPRASSIVENIAGWSAYAKAAPADKAVEKVRGTTSVALNGASSVLKEYAKRLPEGDGATHLGLLGDALKLLQNGIDYQIRVAEAFSVLATTQESNNAWHGPAVQKARDNMENAKKAANAVKAATQSFFTTCNIEKPKGFGKN